MNIKKVDVIIPTYKPDEKFEQLIRSLLHQTFSVQKIIVVNTKTETFPWDIVGFDRRIVVKEINKSQFDHGGTRRMAAGLSDSEVIVCMTQDAVPGDKRLIENLIAPFADDSVGCTYARQLPDETSDVVERYTREFNYPQASCVKNMDSVKALGIKAFFCSNVCAAYRRSCYEEAGGFVKRAIFNEDMIMAASIMKLGYQCVYAAEAKVVHSHNYTCIQQFKRNFDLAVSQADHPEIFEGIPSEKEGIRLVKKTAAYLISVRKPWLVIKLAVNSGFKYAGYLLGTNYKRLPSKLVVKCSSNPRYWAKA
ncbi:glycosyltransferase [Clostridium sp. C105KSO13]|uniref:glycosyltransferase n=1 Tax=Clostridium sp. C105KSO13 TaxID=1776045 RepID=UPI000740756F|nr:glycosyltransferase family 2 protein [Clostridium sp. C105KSO13]CUX33811.1 Glycosyl transferase family 2 [Clostridium sp. C105KSO13]